jgi:Vitamin K-dependent gamma-carboxylase
MKAQSERFGARVERFFFEPEVPYGMALLRIVFPLVMMGMVLPRWHVTRELFSLDGATAQLSIGYGYGELLPEFSGTVAVALYGLMLFALLCTSVGWCTRASLIISGVLFTYFTLLDYVSTMTKYTVIATHVLFILSVSGCGSLWSVDAWLAGRKKNCWPTEPAVERRRFPAWPRRLLQIFIGVVYFGAAVTKMHTPLFFTGDMLQYWMQTHINFQHPIGEYVSLHPILLVGFAYITIVWEVVFLFLSWKSMWRSIILPVGVLFHFMTTLTLGLLLFPMVCYCTYLSFLDEDDVQRCAAWFRRLQRRWSWLKNACSTVAIWRDKLGDPVAWRTSSRAAFLFSMAFFTVANVEVEHWLDLYGERRPQGRHELVAVDPDEVQKLLAPTEPLRISDRFFAIDTGTLMVGDRLADRRTEFRQGELLIAQCNLTPPHEDMSIECKVQDSDNRLIDRFFAIATREMFRVNFAYSINDAIPPGEYALVIQTAGAPVMRKKFHVLARHGGASAN